MKKTGWITLSVLVVSALLLSGCDVFTSTATPTPLPNPVTVEGVISEGNLVPADSLTLSFAVAGTVGEILVEEGDTVTAGAVIARLKDTETYDAQILAAGLAVLQAQQALDDLNEKADLIHAQAEVDLVLAQQTLVAAEKAWDAVDTDDFREDLDDAKVEMNEAENDLTDAQDDLKEYEDLDEDNLLRKNLEDAVDDAQQDYDEARWAYEELQNQYDLAQAQLTAAQMALDDAQKTFDDTADGPDPDALALAQDNLDQAQRQKDAADASLDYVELTAPFAGKIVRMDLVEGAMTAPGQLAAVLIDNSEWYVETNDLTEDEVVQVQIGQPVTVTFDALSGESFDGEVESISQYALEQYGDITYTVRIKLLDENEQLRWGMTAEVDFGN
ncbi:MAG: HlyD family efflux transporter periplasmic adaptor subunit [Anaerolineaceae bacterium]|nr:HlyD family efflux transporter periplasmic adaptor subunit [Anaerolineaceae bacterium]